MIWLVIPNNNNDLKGHFVIYIAPSSTEYRANIDRGQPSIGRITCTVWGICVFI